MFKIGNLEKELRNSMERSLLDNQVEQQYGINKLARAVDHLNNAAKIFQKAGMHSEASEILNVLKDLTQEMR